jgi:hypothetical protein
VGLWEINERELLRAIGRALMGLGLLALALLSEEGG